MATPADIDRPNRHHWPPILYVVVLVVGALMHRQWPLPPVAPWPAATALGWVAIIGGAGVALAALLNFRAIGTTFDPTGPADALATGGIYRVTRNPMYLGAVLAFAGLGIVTGWTWLLVFDVLLPFALVFLAIKPEEAYLERRFGQAYRDYHARVRRWL